MDVCFFWGRVCARTEFPEGYLENHHVTLRYKTRSVGLCGPLTIKQVCIALEQKLRTPSFATLQAVVVPALDDGVENITLELVEAYSRPAVNTLPARYFLVVTTVQLNCVLEPAWGTAENLGVVQNDARMETLEEIEAYFFQVFDEFLEDILPATYDAFRRHVLPGVDAQPVMYTLFDIRENVCIRPCSVAAYYGRYISQRGGRC